jgi:homoserine acetyltransferase
MTALDWGYSTDETANQLMQLSAKARDNGERYAVLTATNAAVAVERKGQGRG